MKDRAVEVQRGTGKVERRKSRRFPVGWPITIKGSDSLGARFEETAILENLSSAGAYLYTDVKLEVGARLEVAIRLPLAKERWMEYPARVIRIDGQNHQESKERDQRALGVAMMFERIKPHFASR